MEDRDSASDAAWEEARGRLFRPAPPPTRAETEAFTQRVLARIPEEAPAWTPSRWLMPSLAFSAAALALSLALPARDEDAADVASAWAAAPLGAEDVLGYTLEDL
ncbi:hypothetical protein EPO15_18005 [bacterium]|nr:MAG: hypothetical protein EPO15_18005 [bacterium]